MKTAAAPCGAHVVDSLPFAHDGTLAQAKALKASGVDCLVSYLGAITPAAVANVLAAGLAFMPVTFGGEYEDGADDEITQLKALGIPAGASVWLDLEGLKAFHTAPPELIAKINAWADKLAAAGFMPCLYVGVPQPLTSDELWGLHVKRYWHGQGSVRDRNGALAEPTKCGWCMVQMFPSYTRGGVWVDSSMIGQDYLARTPVWCVAGAANGG